MENKDDSSRRHCSNENNPDSESLASIRQEATKPINVPKRLEINLNPEYSTDQLLLIMQNFQAASLKLSARSIKKKAIRLKKQIIKFDEDCLQKTGELFSIGFIEHSHYIYELKGLGGDLNEQERNNIIQRERQFNEANYPHERIYSGLLMLFQFVSTLMIRWNLFDLHNYGYRYKGRSLTVKIIDMKTINRECVNPDIAWFSYAINHQPFIGKIEKVIICYAKVLQMQIDKIIKFFRDSDLSHCNFELVPWWKLMKKAHPKINELYELLQELELANRYFEKSLIQEFLRIV